LEVATGVLVELLGDYRGKIIEKATKRVGSLKLKVQCL
jgi:hypothetical protein